MVSQRRGRENTLVSCRQSCKSEWIRLFQDDVVGLTRISSLLSPTQALGKVMSLPRAEDPNEICQRDHDGVGPGKSSVGRQVVSSDAELPIPKAVDKGALGQHKHLATILISIYSYMPSMSIDLEHL